MEYTQHSNFETPNLQNPIQPNPIIPQHHTQPGGQVDQLNQGIDLNFSLDLLNTKAPLQ